MKLDRALSGPPQQPVGGPLLDASRKANWAIPRDTCPSAPNCQLPASSGSFFTSLARFPFSLLIGHASPSRRR
ncbi:hypothetical protein BHE74_00030395 [Ensete ventricosum]|nr:hypothetical protein BHE74_00030395 [Ensete ventricosum]